MPFIFHSFVCWGGGLAAPFAMGSTAVLPKGVRSVRVNGLSTTVDGWYNDIQVDSGVAEPFNQQLSYGRLLKAESNENLKLNVEAQLRNKGVSLDTIAGNSYADINTRVFVTLPAFAYGVTDRFTLALAVPIVYSNLDVETGFVGSPQLQQLVTDFSQKSRKQTNLIQSKLSDVIATELANKGYKPLRDQEQTQVGDLRIVGKYLGYQGINYSWAMTSTITVPTAHVRDVNKVVDPTPGDGQWDLGLVSTFNIPLNAQFSIINQTGYIVQFADVRETRIPISEEERLSRDIDYGANRDLGDQMFTSLGLMMSDASSVFGFGGAYTFAYKQRDVWTGTNASADRYRALGVETEQVMHAAYVQMSLSSINLYKRKKFPLPLLTTLGVGQAFAGRNVRNDPLWSLNMTAFF
jgi:hypothetical protein